MNNNVEAYAKILSPDISTQYIDNKLLGDLFNEFFKCLCDEGNRTKTYILVIHPAKLVDFTTRLQRGTVVDAPAFQDRNLAVVRMMFTNPHYSFVHE